ncbi:rna-binding protein cwf29 [Phaffia rhodozyma]|uniref:Rna-binding protein cwf29 n=1 Tax=Phaffia rhodozyma TaxID=264483 RepID=A0A0F7SHI5_PHARH|nr:rna-binding protein cwf29 [Phaffia rhodozyma]
MNVVREINQINQKELERGGAGSWHDDYKDSAYIFVGGLPFEMTEGDVITVFSQYGEIADVNLPKDKDKGTSRGFAFVMYVDQRSTVLAVDNLNGSKVAGRTLRVDHTKGYTQPKVRNDETGEMEDAEEQSMNAMPALVGEPSVARVGVGAGDVNEDDVDMEDPMANYILEERRREALEGSLSSSKKDKPSKHHHRSKEEKAEKKERKREKELAKEAKKQQRAGSSSLTHKYSPSRSPKGFAFARILKAR